MENAKRSLCELVRQDDAPSGREYSFTRFNIGEQAGAGLWKHDLYSGQIVLAWVVVPEKVYLDILKQT